MNYDSELLETSQRANVENLTRKQLKNEFVFYTTTYKNFAEMPYKHFERICLISDILFDMKTPKVKKNSMQMNATLDDIMKELDSISIDGEDNPWNI